MTGKIREEVSKRVTYSIPQKNRKGKHLNYKEQIKIYGLNKISKLGDPLEVPEKVIDWEMFRSVMTRVCRKESTERGGHPPYDVVMMLKNIVMQRLYNLSDD